MALTQDLLLAQDSLKGLSEEQVNAIVTLSANDENDVIGKRFGETYRQIDGIIEANTGIVRNGDEKTYNYLDRAQKTVNEKVNGLNAEITRLKEENSKLAKGADGELQRKYEQSQIDLNSVTAQYTKLKADFDAQTEKHANELLGIKLDNEFAVAAQGVKFKQGFSEQVAGVILQNAIAKVKGIKSEYIDNGQGGKTLAFKDESGAIMRNPDNKLNPYTAAELIRRELKAMGVLDEGRKATGAGGNGGGGAAVTEFSDAKTQSEAYEAIAKSLNAKGLASYSAGFQKEMDRIWKENNISSLPKN